MHKITGRWQLGLALSLTTAILWGLLPIALKGLLNYLDSVTITWLRFLIAAIVLAPYMAYKRQLPLHGKLFEKPIFGLILIVLIGLLGNYILYMFGLAFTTPESAQVMIQLAPMLLLIGGLVIFNESFNLKQWIGLLTFLIGLVLFFNQRVEQLLTAHGEFFWGILLIFLAAISWAGYALAQKQLLKYFSSQQIMILVYCAGSLIFIPNSTPSLVLELDLLGWFLLLFCGANTLVAYGAFAEALDHWEASRVSATLTLAPLFTLGFMQLTVYLAPGYIDGEELNLLSLIGAFAVVLGSAMTALSKNK